MDCSLPGTSVHGDSPGRNTGLPCPPPGDLPNWGIEPRSPDCRWILNHLSSQGSHLCRRLEFNLTETLGNCIITSESCHLVVSSLGTVKPTDENHWSKAGGGGAYMSAQSCPTLFNPMDYNLPGSSVHGASPGKKWVAVPSSRGSYQPGGWIHTSYVSCIAGRFFTHWATWEAWWWG